MSFQPIGPTLKRALADRGFLARVEAAHLCTEIEQWIQKEFPQLPSIALRGVSFHGSSLTILTSHAAIGMHIKERERDLRKQFETPFERLNIETIRYLWE